MVPQRSGDSRRFAQFLLSTLPFAVRRARNFQKNEKNIFFTNFENMNIRFTGICFMYLFCISFCTLQGIPCACVYMLLHVFVLRQGLSALKPNTSVSLC